MRTCAAGFLVGWWSPPRAAGSVFARRSLFADACALLFPEAKHLQDQMYSFSTNEMTQF